MLNRLLALGLFLLGIVSPALAQREPRNGKPGRGGENRPPRQDPPRQQPPRQRPPVIVPPQAGRPGQPGRGRVMPVSEIKLVNAETANEAGELERALKLVTVSAKDESGADALLLFNRDGAPYDAAAPSPAESLRKSAAFNELTSGQLGW